MQTINNTQKTACLINLGCKVNKYELDCMATILSGAGYNVVFGQQFADVYVINTCAVTSESEKKSRQYVAKLTKYNKEAKIIVCGCASQNNPKQFEIGNVFSIIGIEGKDNILNLIENKTTSPTELTKNYNHNIKQPIKSKTRAYLKVQDGCNNYCSYCLIPYLRGDSRSRNLQEVVKEAHELSKFSQEIVVTGIDLSSYSVNGKLALGELVYSLKDVDARIRLGSLEVNVVTKDNLEFFKRSKNFCPHFHLSLQSGCDNTLKQMNRKYTIKEYLQKVDLIKEYFENANITTDLIVGFGEESDADFSETLDTIKKAQFGDMHIFPFSKREGTEAFKYKAIDKQIINKRRELAEKVKLDNRNNFYNSLIGKVQNVLIEASSDGYYTGYTENYVKCYVLGNYTENQIIQVEIIKAFKDGMLAKEI